MGSPAVQNTQIYNPNASNTIKPLYIFKFTLPAMLFKQNYPTHIDNLGSLIRKARMDKGYMVKELADLIKVNEGSVINWEIHQRTPSRKNMIKLKKSLNLDLTLIK